MSVNFERFHNINYEKNKENIILIDAIKNNDQNLIFNIDFNKIFINNKFDVNKYFKNYEYLAYFSVLSNIYPYSIKNILEFKRIF